MTQLQVFGYWIMGVFIVSLIAWSCWPLVELRKVTRERKLDAEKRLAVAEEEFNRQYGELLAMCDDALSLIPPSYASNPEGKS